jgi:hypothetical protein
MGASHPACVDLLLEAGVGAAIIVVVAVVESGM